MKWTEVRFINKYYNLLPISTDLEEQEEEDEEENDGYDEK